MEKAFINDDEKLKNERLEKLIEKLRNESYNLQKAIEALMYKVVPPDTDYKDDYVLSFLGILNNQARYISGISEYVFNNFDELI